VGGAPAPSMRGAPAGMVVTFMGIRSFRSMASRVRPHVAAALSPAA
jgi:hypothetical protein